MALAEVISEQIPSRLLFAVEPMAEFLREGAPLFVRHREEVSKDKSAKVLAIDEDYYVRNYERGGMIVVTARSFRTLVGYNTWSIHPNPRYKHLLCAQDDVHYLTPECRRGMNGYFLLKRSIEFLKLHGVQYVYVREKIGHEHPAIMKRLGLTPEDITYSGAI